MFEFLEPPILELKLTNAASDSCLIPERLLSGREGATVIVKKDGQPAREYVPYAEYCFESSTQELSPGRSAYEALAPFARLKGLDLAEPGYFTVQVCLHLGNTDVLSNALRLRITPPRGYDEEYLAQDFLTDDVGRVLAMGGSRFLEGANDTFREVAAKLPDRRVAIHAQPRHLPVAWGRHRPPYFGDTFRVLIAMTHRHLEPGFGVLVQGRAKSMKPSVVHLEMPSC